MHDWFDPSRLGNSRDPLTIVDMHTAGEPVRILDMAGLNLGEGPILDKRRRMKTQHDDIRRRLMLEPRGHADMYGAILTQPHDPAAEAGVLFMHNSGYSTMCGHATIALGRYLNDRRAARGLDRLDRFILECPCGPVIVHCEDDRTWFDSVTCFADALDETVDVQGIGPVTFDLGYGGAYYAILPAERLGTDVAKTPARELQDKAGKLVAALRETRTITHPVEADLGFLYGAILTDGITGESGTSRHFCWFGEGQLDRSPTGSGVSARLAVDAARGLARAGDVRTYCGLSGDAFEGKIANRNEDGIVSTVKGRAFYTGLSVMLREEGDPFADGFSLD